jgi:hypothetical protein
MTSEEWKVIDAFEGPMYELERVNLIDGRTGWTYVCNPGTKADEQDWSAQEFEQRELPAFVERCAAWRQRHEAA